MDHLSHGVLAEIFGFLAAKDIAHVTAICRALQPTELVIQHAIGVVIQRHFGDVTPFLREDEPSWPRTLLVLRAAEVMRVKALLASAGVQTYEEAVASTTLSFVKSTVVVSKAWIQAWKKRCQLYEQYLLQFRMTKKKRLQQERILKQKKGGANSRDKVVVGRSRFADTEIAATRQAGALIVCQHDALLPFAQCVGRSKRVVLPRSVFGKLAVYATDVRGFPLEKASDCWDCIQEREAQDREVESRKLERFESEIAGSNDLLDLLLRKSGYPNELFSPASTRGRTHLSLANGGGLSYFLVPKKWLTKWRKFVKSLGDDVPGPILNAELVCLAHGRSIVPPYITMFLSGFSIEQSLQATQALGACPSKQYEIVTCGEWEALHDRYCAEFAVGFDVVNGSYHWKTQECNICNYGMTGSGTGKRILLR